MASQNLVVGTLESQHSLAVEDVSHHLLENGDPAEVYCPPTAEQLFWARKLRRWVAPSDRRGDALSRAMRAVGITPIAHLAWFSLSFQTYLYEIFHRTTIARIGHFLLMPLLICTGLAAAAPLAIAGPVNGSAMLALLLAVGYAVYAARERLYLWGAVMVLSVGGLLLAANALAALPFFTPALGLVGLLALPLAISLSHVKEPLLPPRAIKSNRWTSISEYLASAQPDKLALLARLGRLGLLSVYGALDELWATPRLYPIGVLRVMFAFGYAPARRLSIATFVERALASGNPALDFIGSGGGAFLAPGSAPRPVDEAMGLVVHAYPGSRDLKRDLLAAFDEQSRLELAPARSSTSAETWMSLPARGPAIVRARGVLPCSAERAARYVCHELLQHAARWYVQAEEGKVLAKLDDELRVLSLPWSASGLQRDDVFVQLVHARADGSFIEVTTSADLPAAPRGRTRVEHLLCAKQFVPRDDGTCTVTITSNYAIGGVAGALMTRAAAARATLRGTEREIVALRTLLA
jgi:hypothetical protein